MTVVNYETGEIVERLDRDEAERLSNRIALRLDTIADNYEAVVPMIRESVEREAWSALGYRSPGEYAADRFGGALARLGAEFRQAVTRELAEMGMSTRAIAGVVGTSKDTVRRDLDATGADAPVGTTVTGLNGKTYARPTPRPQTSDEQGVAAWADEGGHRGHAEPDLATSSPEPSRPVESVAPSLADLDDTEPDVQPEAGSQPPTPSPRTDPTEDDLNDFLDSNAAVQDSRYLLALTKALGVAASVHQFDPKRVADIADDATLLALEAAFDNFSAFRSRVLEARSGGLRVIRGGLR